MARKNFSSGSSFEKEMAYSRVVEDGRWVFVSGTTGYNYDTMKISDDIVEQAEQCMINIEQALRQADAKMSDVVRVMYILPTGTNFYDCAPVLQKYFGEVRPAATMIHADLLNPDMKIEIQVTALKEQL